MNTSATLTSLPATFLLHTLQARLDSWKAGQEPLRNRSGLPSGFAEVDEVLPDEGWPQGALTELLTDETGVGEFSLLLPVLARLTARQGVLLVAPPFLPHAPALAQAGVDLDRLLVVPAGASRDALPLMAVRSLESTRNTSATTVRPRYPLPKHSEQPVPR